MRPCRRCGQTNPRRMIALMTLWFGPAAGLPLEGGYFYLCPSCYHACIGPRVAEILHRLTEHHPLGRHAKLQGDDASAADHRFDES